MKNLILIAALLFSKAAFARTELEIGGASTKKAEESEADSAQSKSFGLGVSYRHVMGFDGDAITGFRLRAKASKNTLDPLPGFDREISISQATVGATYFSVSKSKQLLAFNLSAHVTGDGDAEAVILPAAAFLGASSWSENIIGIYGLAYVYSFGDGALLPILGVNWNTSENTILVFIFPLRLSFIISLSDSMKLDLFLRPQGYRSVVANNNTFAGAGSDLKYRSREGAIGVRLRGELSSDIDGFVELGVSGKRQVTILDGDHEVFREEIQTAPFVGVGLKFGFGGGFERDKTSQQPDVLNEI